MLPFFEWCEATSLGQLIKDSVWLFPVIECGHLLALSVLLGSLLVVDLRLLGLGLRGQSIAEVARGTERVFTAAIAAMAVSGILLFLSEAVKCYHNPSFWVKVTTLPVALLFTLTVRRRIARRGGMDATATTRLVAIGSLFLWFTVAAAGRWIGFSS